MRAPLVFVSGRTERRPSCLNTMMGSSFPSVTSSLNMRSWRRSDRELSGEYLMLVQVNIPLYTLMFITARLTVTENDNMGHCH